MRKCKRFLSLVLALVCALLCISPCICPTALAEETPLKHYLVLGQDYYTLKASTSTRTDTLLLVSLDSAGNRIIFTSILRDCKVTTPNGGENKLNTVFVNYGFEGIRSTLESHLGVKIEGIVTIDFETVKDLVDAFGGVDIEISQTEYGMIHSILLGDDPNMPKGPGLAHMTGRIALAYMRDRSSGGSDFSRTAHQREVISQLLSKASELSLPDLLNVYNTLSGKVNTDMSQLQLLSALQTAYGLMGAEIVEHHVPADHTFAYGRLRGSSVLDVRWKRNRELLQELFYPETVAQP